MKSGVQARSDGSLSSRKQPPSGKVRFEFVHSTARRVSVVGTFNGWNADVDQMTLRESGNWVKELELPPGTYEYRYVVDGEWVQDPRAEHSVINPFGERNSLLSVRARTED